MNKLCTAIEFGTADDFYVKYRSPRRKIYDFRTELNTDAIEISKQYGPVYIGLSSGIDSQIITRCFLDNKLDCEFVFLYVKGVNDLEYERVIWCEKYFGIDVRKYTIDINSFKDEWIVKSKTEKNKSMHQYQFEWLSSNLENPYPFVTQGAYEPAIVGGWYRQNRDEEHDYPVAIYHNYEEAMLQRRRLMENHRPVLEFPFSPEAVSSYYTHTSFKTFCKNINYFIECDPVMPSLWQEKDYFMHKLNYFNLYAKPFIKGEQFKDILWYGKLSGYEQTPNWVVSNNFNKATAITVPYWDLVDFLENNLNEEKIYKSWIF
jgi:hypothetical protein